MADKPKLAVSFSGGRSSAVMTKLLWDECRDTRELSIAFANTGCEHEATLEFVHECEVRFGWPVAWLEAVVSPVQGEGVRHRVVNFASASRNGEPFEAAVAKYGIFNQTAKSCTTRLKENVMESYRRSIGFRFGKHLDHDTAIGIRADEVDRISERRELFRFVYPLIRRGITKRDVALEIRSWGFDLKIPGDHFGNCTWCWKKSLRKHMTLAIEAPEVFDFPRRMEQQYGHVNGDTAAAHNGRRYWFRGHQSVDDIFRAANETTFVPYTDDRWDHGKDHELPFDDALDRGSSCGESCEIGADEDV